MVLFLVSFLSMLILSLPVGVVDATDGAGVQILIIRYVIQVVGTLS